MNKSHLIDAIARESGLTKSDAQAALESLLKNISKALQNDENVRLSGFGTFSTKTRKAREGVNPKTRQVIQLPERTVVKFKAGKGLI